MSTFLNEPKFAAQLGAAKRRGQKHFNFAYSIEQLADSQKPFWDIAVGSYVGICAWLWGLTGWWSFTFKTYGVDGELKPVNVNANDRVPVLTTPKGVVPELRIALDKLIESNPDVDALQTIVSVTYSLTKPTSTYGQNQNSVDHVGAISK
ncbi:MAG: hypothetical protein RLY58_2245 [Pseudomonadota bacterium]|jgi:hypothetical protein